MNTARQDPSDEARQDLENRLKKLRDAMKDGHNVISMLHTLTKVKLSGSKQIIQIVDDIELLIMFTYDKVDITKYPKDFQKFWSFLLYVQEKGIAYGWEEKVSNEERFCMLIAGKLFSYLVERMNEELNSIT